MTHHWIALITLYLQAQHLAGSPLTTLTTRKQHLQHLARRVHVEPQDLTGTALATYAAAQKWARETARGRRSTFRSFFGWAHANGHIPGNPSDSLPRVKAGTPNPRPVPERAYREALMKAPPRETLMLRLAAEMGLRRAEVAVVNPRWDLYEDLVGWSLLVHGKGQKDRVVPCPDSIAVLLRALPAGYAFPGDHDGHLSPRWVGKLVTELLPGDWTMHKLRHRFASKAFAGVHDLLALKNLLGHASVATTEYYTAVDDDALRRAVAAAA